MLNIKKNKALSKLIAFTFAFNAIAPVAFASDTTSSGLSLKSVNNDILTRIATTATSNFKSRNLNISDEEINNLMANVYVSSGSEESYYSQEEKDYDALQLLIAKGLGTAEARATALKNLQDLEALSKIDESVGGLTKTEQYVKQLLEQYDDIESRANASSAISSAITTSDNAITAYRTILKIAKAERLACRNDATANKAKADKGEKLAEGTNTDPDKCVLSAKGKEAAQMLTYLSNAQINQTTDSKKTTTATNSTTTQTGERKCETAGTTLAVNDNTRCCPTQQPFYNSTTAKCVASLSSTTNNSSKDDDDETSDTALLQYLMSQQQNCQNNGGALNIIDRCTIPTSGGSLQSTKDEVSRQESTKKSKGKRAETDRGKNNKTVKNGNSKANNAIMSRISDIKIEFNENNKDDAGYYVHLNDSSTEYQIKVTLEEKATNDKENQNPLHIKLYTTQYVGENSDNSTLYRFTQTAKNGEFTTIVYPETMKPASSDATGHFVKKVLSSNEYYTLGVTITDGIYESAPFYIKYRIVDAGTKITSNDKDQSTGQVSIIGQQSKVYDTETTGNASLDVSSAKYENSVCKLTVEGALVTSTTENAQKIPASEYELDNINEADCIKLNEDAKNNKLHMTANNAQITDTLKDGTVVLKSDSDVLPAFSVDGGENYLDTNDYLTSTASTEETSFNIKNGVPFGKFENKDVVYMDGSLKVKNENGSFEDVTSEQLSEMLHEEVPDGSYADFDFNENGEILINIKNANDEVLKTITTTEIAEKTIKQVQKHGLDSDTAKSADRVVANFKNATIRVLGGSVVAEATSTNSIERVAAKAKEAFNNIKKVNASNTNKIEVSKTAPSTIDIKNK